jgi:hypothetical protein
LTSQGLSRIRHFEHGHGKACSCCGLGADAPHGALRDSIRVRLASINDLNRFWHDVVLPLHTVTDAATCNSGDYVTGGGWEGTGRIIVHTSEAQALGPGPVQWKVTAENTDGGISQQLVIVAVCQTPITVAGIGVPQFGSLHVAIALGAVAYFMLSRRFARRPTILSRA